MTLLLGLDQGTSGTKAYLLDEEGRRRGLGYIPLRRLHPHPDWTEQDPNDVAAGAAQAIDRALAEAGATPADIRAVGIASQRDTDFAWDAATRTPIAHAITWQDLRATALAEELDAWEHAGERRHRLGYFPGPWCAALHMAWRMQHQPEWRRAVESGGARIGMAAGWLLAALGEPSAHVHDYSLVQKTGLWDFRAGAYWQDWAERLGLSTTSLPAPVPTLHDFGWLRIQDVNVPVVAMIADQQAALFGQSCRQPGQAECTHGTVSFVKVVAGSTPPELDALNVYHAWSWPMGWQAASGKWQVEWDLPSAIHTYCLEADTTTTGAAVRWLATQAGMLADETEIDALAGSVPDAGGVSFVPAFTGLNVPYNDHAARAAILGMSLGANRGHIARALLEAVAFQARAILESIHAQTGLNVQQLNVGGGLSRSDLACQLQADLLGIPVMRPEETETTARGAALLAGLGASVWRSLDELPPLPGHIRTFEPGVGADERDHRFARWQAAIATVRSFASASHY